ncbi:VTT domain-containing protein [Streptomyces sp. JV176]|uniref:VTT domain-containing protein n=1 Tax=Streptomyces sp. JV176 TaxID=858630 RepID=UPI002E79230F|nr:VTT domain-containing protein [Streptomyces sp. JV176]MEE1797796.1 VTT domain-containing protein [Streptomyces sp. JV176]
MAVLVVLPVPEAKVHTGGHSDLTGAVGLTTGPVCLLLSASKAEDWGWAGATTLFATAAITPLLWGWFLPRSPQPMVDAHATVRSQVPFTHLAALGPGFALFVRNLALPHLLQTPETTGHGPDRSQVVTDLSMATPGLTLMAVSPLSARLTKTKGPTVPLLVGSGVVGTGQLLAIVMMSEARQIVAASCVLAIGVGSAPGALPTLITDAMPVFGTAATVGLNPLMPSIGTSVSSAVAGMILAHRTIDFDDITLPPRNGPRTVLAIGGCRRRLPGLRALHPPPAVGHQLRGSTRADRHGRAKARHRSRVGATAQRLSIQNSHTPPASSTLPVSQRTSLSKISRRKHMMLYLAQTTGEPTGGVAGWAFDVIDALGGLGVGVLTALDSLAFGALPVDVLLPLIGYTAGQGAINIVVAIVCAAAGVVAGSLFQYTLGARLGRDRARALLVRIPGIKPETVDRAEAWFARHGAKAVLFGRMLPVVRPIISIPAGVERMALPKFVLLSLIGSLIWNAILLGSGYLLGENWHRVVDIMGYVPYVFFGALAVGVPLFLRRRNRRRKNAATANIETNTSR